MRVCACLWGGTFNPIIPVFKKAPKDWKSEPFERVTGKDVARGYVRFFEPDVYVEAEQGLLEEAGLGGLREKHVIYPSVMTLAEMQKVEHGKTQWQPPFGLSVRDIFAHLYRSEQRFVLRDKRENLLIAPERGSALVESIFGVYPTTSNAAYLKEDYVGVFQPLKCKAEPETWRKAFRGGGFFPFLATRHGLNLERFWHHA